MADWLAAMPPINGIPPACSRPHTHSQYSIQVRSFKIHLVEVLLELERVRRIKSGSAVKIKREIKKD